MSVEPHFVQKHREIESYCTSHINRQKNIRAASGMIVVDDRFYVVDGRRYVSKKAASLDGHQVAKKLWYRRTGRKTSTGFS